MRRGGKEKMSTNFSSYEAVTGNRIFSTRSTSRTELTTIFERSSAAAALWRRNPADVRIDLVRRYGKYLFERRDEIADLISREIGKLGWDAAGEVSAAIAKVELSISAMVDRRADHWVDADRSIVERYVRFRPIGVALVLGPFNFPLHLPGGQIIPALLAGNSIVFKPSEQATAVGAWIADAWKTIGLPDDLFQMIVGGVDVAVAAIDCPEVGAVFFTGSRSAGQSIHRQLAGRPEVLLALEMGGNNPIVVADTVDPQSAAKCISFSAFVSSGQRCTCARRAIFVKENASDQVIAALIDATDSLPVGLPNDSRSSRIGPLISATAAARLHQTYQRLVELGCNPLIPWKVDQRCESLVSPTILDAEGISDDALHEIGEMEWFGPMLVLARACDFDGAIKVASRTPYGLAASLLGGTREMFEHFAVQVGTGIVNWNGPTTGAAGVMPFGGLGASGNHRPAGYHAIDFCSDPIASLQQSTMSTTDPWSVAN